MAGTAVLCVDPDETQRERTATELRDELDCVTLRAVSSIAEAREVLREQRVDCLVTEYRVSDGAGLELVAHVRETAPDTSCILFTTAERDAMSTDSVGAVVTEYLPKDHPDATSRLARMVRATTTFRSQTSYPLPTDEDERLATIRQYDFEAESLHTALDRITRLAADHFETPVASVNLIREHTQTVLSCHGADWSSTAREDSICTFSILEDETATVIEDATADPRFEHNEAVQDLGIRSYAGYPLTTPNGSTLGTLCIYDSEPRTFTAADGEYLRLLAEEATDRIELHQRLADRSDDGSTPPRGTDT